MKKTRLKPEQKVICTVSFGGRFNIQSEESITKLSRLGIKENDFVIVLDTITFKRNLGKVIHKKPYGVIPQKALRKATESMIIKKATWFDKFLDKMRLL